MKKKTHKVYEFLDGLHKFIVHDPQFRKDTSNKSEVRIQTEIRPVIIRYLTKYFEKMGYKDAYAKANESFYWEGQEGNYGKRRKQIFGARNYPDFIITKPYLIAIEYKKSDNGGLVKTGIGQSIMHTLSGDFDYVYYLFHDQNKGKKIHNSIRNEPKEKEIISMIWDKFNVFLKSS